MVNSINSNGESILLLHGCMTLSITIVNRNYQLTVHVVQNSLGNFEISKGKLSVVHTRDVTIVVFVPKDV